MPVVKHTMQCPIDGFESLLLVWNLGMTQTQYTYAREHGTAVPALIDMPNWDAQAEALGFVGTDAETGEPNGIALPKPSFPLTDAALLDLPFVLVSYLASDDAIGDALRDYRETRSPNSLRR